MDRGRYTSIRWDAAAQRRFWSYVSVGGPEDCWIWKGYLAKGYGRFSIDNKTYAAHRVLKIKTEGIEHHGLLCDHLCRNRACVNPLHIEMVTDQVNVRRGIAGYLNTARASAMTVCKNGHPYTPENTFTDKRGRRTCRTCRRKYWKTYKQKIRAIASQEGK